MKTIPIFVLGMHRSGTSCLTGCLQEAGLFLGEVFTANPHNKKGNRENARVMELNSAVLIHSGGDWNSPPKSLSWTQEHKQERDDIIASMENNAATRWGIKDPRFTFTLPFWQEAISNPQLVASFRHPNAVAASLEARNRMSHESGIELWTQYNEKLLTYLDRSSFPLICFDKDKEQYFRDINRLYQVVCLESFGGNIRFYEEGLRKHSTNNDDVALPEEARNIYTRLMNHYSLQFKSDQDNQ